MWQQNRFITSHQVCYVSKQGQRIGLLSCFGEDFIVHAPCNVDLRELTNNYLLIEFILDNCSFVTPFFSRNLS